MMADVNQMLYAKDFLRLETSVKDATQFMGNSGAWYGNLLIFILIIACLFVIFGIIYFVAHKSFKM